MDKTFGEPRVVVVGVGGCGGNTVDHLVEFGVQGAELLALNTDMQDLNKIQSPKKIVLGPGVTHGLGAGMRPELGAKAMEESLDAVLEELEDAHMVFLVAGLGGGTGSGALPVLVRALAERMPEVLTLAMLVLPWRGEGAYRQRVAEESLEAIKQYVDSYIVLRNDRLMELAEQKKFTQALKEGSMVVYRSVKGIVDIITRAGIINVDFQDVRTVLESGGRALMGIGFAEGQDRAIQAVEKALKSPLLDDMSIHGARNILVNILFDEDEPDMREVDAIMEYVMEEVDPDGYEPLTAYGMAQHEGLGNKIQVTLVVSGLSDEAPPSTRRGRIGRPVSRRPRDTGDVFPTWRRDRRDIPPYIRRIQE